MTAEQPAAVRNLPIESGLYIFTGELNREFDLAGYTTGTLEDSWPSDVIAHVELALELVLAEPLSFPYEAMTPRAWEVPMTVVLPEELPVETIADLLAEPLFARFTIFDRVITDNDEAWTWLRRRFGFLEVQRLRRWGRDLRVILGDLGAVRALVEAADGAYERPVRQIDRWALRTAVNKGRHLIQRRALGEQVDAVRSSLAQGAEMRVSHFGIGVGRFLDLYSGADVTGFDTTPWVVDQCRHNSEATSVLVIGRNWATPVRQGSSDLTVAVHMLGDASLEQRRALLQEMWRVTRIGGRIVVLDDFCTPGTLGARHLVDEIFEIGGASLLMCEVDTLRYDHSGRIGDGLIAVMPISSPGVA